MGLFSKRLLAVGSAALFITGAGIARAADAGVATDAGPVDAGPGSCTSDLECAAPLPYCRQDRCVECLGDRNCAAGEVCDQATGKCTGCVTSADCSSSEPYCSSTGKCVECLSSANCGDLGLECKDGQCGFCGDGICGPREAIMAFENGPFGGSSGSSGGGPVVCLEDCAAKCPTRDAGSALAKIVIPSSALSDLYQPMCLFSSAPDATIAWKAPRDGTFYFAASTADTNLSIGTLSGGCTGFEQGCSGGSPSVSTQADMQQGDAIVLLVETETVPADGVTIEITDQAPPTSPCSGPFCPPPVSSPDSGTTGNDQGMTQCLQNATDRGEAVCAGTECACSHCPQDYDDCAVIPGCHDVRACMDGKRCIGADCYSSGACRTVIDAQGGISGAAFRAAAGLQSCSLTFACQLPCGAQKSSDAGGASPDAGRLCAPGRAVACACEGGTGTKTCAADGNGFGPCVCSSGAPAPAAGGGCGCHVSRTEGGWPGAVGLAAALALLGLRRRSSRGEARP